MAINSDTSPIARGAITGAARGDALDSNPFGRLLPLPRPLTSQLFPEASAASSSSPNPFALPPLEIAHAPSIPCETLQQVHLLPTRRLCVSGSAQSLSISSRVFQQSLHRSRSASRATSRSLRHTNSLSSRPSPMPVGTAYYSSKESSRHSDGSASENRSQSHSESHMGHGLTVIMPRPSQPLRQTVHPINSVATAFYGRNNGNGESCKVTPSKFVDPVDEDGSHRVIQTDPSGRYECWDICIGKGAYKEVYKAFDNEEGVEVAWNQLRADMMPSRDLAKIFDEVKLLESLQHENIINFFDVWTASDRDGRERVYFVTELMSSGNLKSFIRKTKGTLKPKVVKNLCRHIVRGLVYLHSHVPPVIHRDLKCDNIFINGNNGIAKIGDLGLATIKTKELISSVLGTPEFMAPELYDEKYDERVDIYAFGMCVLELITKEYPYQECINQAQIYKRVCAGIFPEALAKITDVETKEFIELCIRHNFRQRPTAKDLMDHPFLAAETNLPQPMRSSLLHGVTLQPSLKSPLHCHPQVQQQQIQQQSVPNVQPQQFQKQAVQQNQQPPILQGQLYSQQQTLTQGQQQPIQQQSIMQSQQQQFHQQSILQSQQQQLQQQQPQQNQIHQVQQKSVQQFQIHQQPIPQGQQYQIHQSVQLAPQQQILQAQLLQPQLQQHVPQGQQQQQSVQQGQLQPQQLIQQQAVMQGQQQQIHHQPAQQAQLQQQPIPNQSVLQGQLQPQQQILQQSVMQSQQQQFQQALLQGQQQPVQQGQLQPKQQFQQQPLMQGQQQQQPIQHQPAKQGQLQLQQQSQLQPQQQQQIQQESVMQAQQQQLHQQAIMQNRQYQPQQQHIPQVQQQLQQQSAQQFRLQPHMQQQIQQQPVLPGQQHQLLPTSVLQGQQYQPQIQFLSQSQLQQHPKNSQQHSQLQPLLLPQEPGKQPTGLFQPQMPSLRSAQASPQQNFINQSPQDLQQSSFQPLALQRPIHHTQQTIYSQQNMSTGTPSTPQQPIPNSDSMQNLVASLHPESSQQDCIGQQQNALLHIALQQPLIPEPTLSPQPLQACDMTVQQFGDAYSHQSPMDQQAPLNSSQLEQQNPVQDYQNQGGYNALPHYNNMQSQRLIQNSFLQQQSQMHGQVVSPQPQNALQQNQTHLWQPVQNSQQQPDSMPMDALLLSRGLEQADVLIGAQQQTAPFVLQSAVQVAPMCQNLMDTPQFLQTIPQQQQVQFSVPIQNLHIIQNPAQQYFSAMQGQQSTQQPHMIDSSYQGQMGSLQFLNGQNQMPQVQTQIQQTHTGQVLALPQTHLNPGNFQQNQQVPLMQLTSTPLERQDQLQFSQFPVHNQSPQYLTQTNAALMQTNQQIAVHNPSQMQQQPSQRLPQTMNMQPSHHLLISSQNNYQQLYSDQIAQQQSLFGIGQIHPQSTSSQMQSPRMQNTEHLAPSYQIQQQQQTHVASIQPPPQQQTLVLSPNMTFILPDSIGTAPQIMAHTRSSSAQPAMVQSDDAVTTIMDQQDPAFEASIAGNSPISPKQSSTKTVGPPAASALIAEHMSQTVVSRYSIASGGKICPLNGATGLNSSDPPPISAQCTGSATGNTGVNISILLIGFETEKMLMILRMTIDTVTDDIPLTTQDIRFPYHISVDSAANIVTEMIGEEVIQRLSQCEHSKVEKMITDVAFCPSVVTLVELSDLPLEEKCFWLNVLKIRFGFDSDLTSLSPTRKADLAHLFDAEHAEFMTKVLARERDNPGQIGSQRYFLVLPCPAVDQRVHTLFIRTSPLIVDEIPDELAASRPSLLTFDSSANEEAVMPTPASKTSARDPELRMDDAVSQVRRASEPVYASALFINTLGPSVQTKVASSGTIGSTSSLSTLPNTASQKAKLAPFSAPSAADSLDQLAQRAASAALLVAKANISRTMETRLIDVDTVAETPISGITPQTQARQLSGPSSNIRGPSPDNLANLLFGFGMESTVSSPGASVPRVSTNPLVILTSSSCNSTLSSASSKYGPSLPSRPVEMDLLCLKEDVVFFSPPRVGPSYTSAASLLTGLVTPQATYQGNRGSTSSTTSSAGMFSSSNSQSPVSFFGHPLTSQEDLQRALSELQTKEISEFDRNGKQSQQLHQMQLQEIELLQQQNHKNPRPKQSNLQKPQHISLLEIQQQQQQKQQEQHEQQQQQLSQLSILEMQPPLIEHPPIEYQRIEYQPIEYQPIEQHPIEQQQIEEQSTGQQPIEQQPTEQMSSQIAQEQLWQQQLMILQHYQKNQVERQRVTLEQLPDKLHMHQMQQQHLQELHELLLDPTSDQLHFPGCRAVTLESNRSSTPTGPLPTGNKSPITPENKS